MYIYIYIYIYYIHIKIYLNIMVWDDISILNEIYLWSMESPTIFFPTEMIFSVFSKGLSTSVYRRILMMDIEK